MVSVRKRGNVYQYQFDVAPVDGKILFWLFRLLANSKNTFSADSKFILLFCNVSVIKM